MKTIIVDKEFYIATSWKMIGVKLIKQVAIIDEPEGNGIG